MALGAEAASGVGGWHRPSHRFFPRKRLFPGLSLPALGALGLSDLGASGRKLDGGWCPALQRQEWGAPGTPGCERLTAGACLGIPEAPEPLSTGQSRQKRCYPALAEMSSAQTPEQVHRHLNDRWV